MRPLFLRIVREGKGKHKPHNDTRTNKAGNRTSRGQEDKPRKAGKEIKAGAKRTKRKANTRAKGQDRGQERGQKRTKEDKIEANTPQVI